MEKDREILRYEQAASVLPGRLRQAAAALPLAAQAEAEEFRLRTGRPLTVLGPEGERELDARVEAEDLEVLCNLATEFSRYAASETLRAGYLPVRGGCRIGLCGTAVMRDGYASTLKDLSSASIRIARQKRGIAEELAPRLFQDGRFRNTLILSPPGGGKTTLLRDLVRCLSDGVGCPPLRLSLIDERSEVAVMYQGEPQMEVGRRTDVLDGCPKALGIPMLLRAMNPQVIAVDEITVREDLHAMALAVGCGVGLLATIHAADAGELMQKPLYAELLDSRVFSRTICIRRTGTGREYVPGELPC